MHFTGSLATLLALGAIAIPATALPTAADSSTFLDDQWAAEGSTNATIDDTAASNIGRAHVRNACPFSIVLQRCYQPHAGHPAGCNPIQTLAAHGGTHTETYTPYANNGISLKVRRQGSDFSTNTLQFEYTNRGPDLHPRISYDISEVNSDANDFWRKDGGGGFTLTASDAQCFHKHCAPPCENCPGVFTRPRDGTPHYCGYGKDIGMTVCG
ncbi:MAG: hypothetical protein Q9195_006576 [Heterodermia aff. obscurata]